MIEIKLQYKEILEKFRKAPKRFHEIIAKRVSKESKLLSAYVITKHLTGGTSATKLAVRSGDMRRRTRASKTVQKGDTLEGGVTFGVKYATTHVGPKGQVTKIEPKGGGNLAIPVGPALTASGVARYSGPRDVPGLTFIPSHGGGNKTGVMAKQDGNILVAYFVLVKSVEIPTRIHPEEIMKVRKAAMERRFDKAIQKGASKL